MRRAGVFAQVVCGIVLVAALWFVIRFLIHDATQRSLPEGFAIIRPPAEVCAMVMTGDQLWTGGKDGLVIISRDTLKSLEVPPGASHFSRVWSMCMDQRARIWIGHDRGLAVYSKRHWQSVPTGSIRPVLALHPLAASRILVGGSSGAGVVDETGWSPIKIPRELSLPSYDVVFEDSSGRRWFGSAHPTRGGLLCQDHDGWRRIRVGDQIPHTSVNAILETSTGALWFATGFASRGGAARLSAGTWTQFTPTDGLAGNKVRSIFEDSGGRLFFGSEYDGLAVRDNDHTWAHLRPDQGLAGREVKTVLEDDLHFWLGTDSGLSRIRKTALAEELSPDS